MSYLRGRLGLIPFVEHPPGGLVSLEGTASSFHPSGAISAGAIRYGIFCGAQSRATSRRGCGAQPRLRAQAALTRAHV